MPKGDIVGMFTGKVFFSLMARKITMMENRKSISSGGGVNNMQRSKKLKRRIVTIGSASQINDMDEL